MLTADNPSNTTFCITRNINGLEDNIHLKRAAKFIDLVSSTVESPPVGCSTKELVGTPLMFMPKSNFESSPPDSPPSPHRYTSSPGSMSPTQSPGCQPRFKTMLTLPSMTLPAYGSSSPKTVAKSVLYTIATPGVLTRPRLLNIANGAPSSNVVQKMEIDRDAQQMLVSLRRDRIHRVLSPDNLVHFDIDWLNPGDTNPTENTEYLDKFMAAFEAQMMKLIEKAIHKQRSIARHSHIVEILQHLTMCRQRSQVCM